MKTQKKRISNHQNLLKLPIEITRDKMKKPSIHYHRQQNLTTSSKGLNISQNWMCVGDMTTNISKTETNGRWPRQTNNYLNQWLCLPIYVPLQRHPRPKWMRYFRNRRTNIRLSTITPRWKKKLLNTHNVYCDDQEMTMMSSTSSYTMQPSYLRFSDFSTIAAKSTTHSLYPTRHIPVLSDYLTIGWPSRLFPPHYSFQFHQESYESACNL